MKCIHHFVGINTFCSFFFFFSWNETISIWALTKSLPIFKFRKPHTYPHTTPSPKIFKRHASLVLSFLPSNKYLLVGGVDRTIMQDRGKAGVWKEYIANDVVLHKVRLHRKTKVVVEDERHVQKRVGRMAKQKNRRVRVRESVGCDWGDAAWD